ncbi:phage holin family protein [Gordonia sp. ABSL49_1]|uniref:phage holin family protein n=1 Tax=Gordonia sp. ABSL49_1 TaxID=2920941 RepID=UPI001F0D8D29|nr:phage holin family protein [Gordonia sp. ABSL49_1]MCH5641225.1 phage holin family protein [Gordonia sp. ABSL49_1]
MTRHRQSSDARLIKAFGLIGYGGLILGLALVALAIGGAAGGRGGWYWAAVGAVVVVGVAVGLLIAGRRLSRRQPAEVRVQEDPLQPEVTAEEEDRYEARYRAGTDPGQ